MEVEAAFVDRIGPGETVVLDLNTAPYTVGPTEEGLDLSPAPVERLTGGSPLRPGTPIARTRELNRTLTIPVGIAESDAHALFEAQSALWTELARERNWLRVRVVDPVTGPTPYGYFRTWRADDTTLQAVFFESVSKMLLKIPADPGCYTAREQVMATVPNNPATAGGLLFDVPAPDGDMEAPCVLVLTPSAASDMAAPVMGKRAGTFADIVFHKQAEEAGTVYGPDTAITSDAGYSGGQAALCTYATVPGEARRWTFPTFLATDPTHEIRGAYRLFAVVRGTGGLTDHLLRLEVHDPFYEGFSPPLVLASGEQVPVATGGGTTRYVVDLGDLSVPTGKQDVPVIGLGLGFGGAPGAVEVAYPPQVAISAQRVSGTGGIALDYIVAVPSDESLSAWSMGNLNSSFPDAVLDSVSDTGPPGMEGVTHTLTPGVLNRFVLLRPDGPVAFEVRASDSIAATTAVTCYYWPAYHGLPWAS